MEAPEDIPSIRSLRPQRRDARGELAPQQVALPAHHNDKWQERTLHTTGFAAAHTGLLVLLVYLVLFVIFA